MSKLSLTLTAALLSVPALVPATSALAQNTKISEIIVYARKPESERYRIPEKLRQGGSLQSRQSWANRAIALETYGRTGINSCSPVGPGGFTGCNQQLVNQAFKERGEQYREDTAPEE
jgi:hypothetical protein